MKKMVFIAMYVALCGFILTGCSHNGVPFEQKDYTTDGAQITEIRMDVRDRAIEVALSADDQIHIEYFESQKEYYDISIDDGVLTMASAANKEWMDYIGGKPAANYRKISLRVPERLLHALRLSTTNADIILSPLTILENVELSATGGDIIFDKLNAGNAILLNAKNGNISGTILGSYDDYAISCHIKKGESNLPAEKTGGPKMLNVTGNNGDVAIDFIPE